MFSTLDPQSPAFAIRRLEHNLARNLHNASVVCSTDHTEGKLRTTAGVSRDNAVPVRVIECIERVRPELKVELLMYRECLS